MADEIYLDNSATTAICSCAKEKIIQMTQLYGNPSSLHAQGFEAAKEILAARRAVLATLGLRAIRDEHYHRLIFTSCGTEATTLALFGTAYAKERREASRIITTDSEHPSVENALSLLQKRGFEIVKISTRGGVLNMDELYSALDKPIFLASLMLVNNETGALYDVKTAFEAIKKKYPFAITHCDAVQGYLKIKFTPESLYADLVSISAHKIHGPKGVGALYVAPHIIKEKRLVTILPGGGQEYGVRSGTENTIGIAAFGAAASEGFSSMAKNIPYLLSLRDYAIQKLSTLGIKMNLPQGNFAPHILNITLPSIKSQTALNFLSAKGIYVSSGSACSSHSNLTSKTLLAFGLSNTEADCSLRISFSKYNTFEDIDALTAALSEGMEKLVKIKGSVATSS